MILQKQFIKDDYTVSELIKLFIFYYYFISLKKSRPSPQIVSTVSQMTITSILFNSKPITLHENLETAVV